MWTMVDGVWSGKTAQGLPASFTVSNRTITAITVPYDFNGCSGIKSSSNLNVSISQSSGPMPVQVSYTSGPLGGPDQTNVFFVIYPNAVAINVTASFFNYTGCGSGATFFTAFKGSPPTYDGPWSGSTSQGAPIAFVVADLRIASITIGFNFGGCAGTTTYPNLTVPIAAVGGGVVLFTGYPGCANQSATWSAALSGGR